MNLNLLIRAVVVGVIVTLVSMLAGALLVSLKIDLATTVGDFLTHWAGALGVLAALWFFFSGGNINLRG